MNAADRTTARRSNGRLDLALVLALFAALGGQYWLMFSMNERHSRDIAELNASLSGYIAEQNVRLSGGIAELSERIARIETLLQYIVPHIVPNAADLPPNADL